MIEKVLDDRIMSDVGIWIGVEGVEGLFWKNKCLYFFILNVVLIIMIGFWVLIFYKNMFIYNIENCDFWGWVC